MHSGHVVLLRRHCSSCMARERVGMGLWQLGQVLVSAAGAIKSVEEGEEVDAAVDAEAVSAAGESGVTVSLKVQSAS